MGEYSPAKTGEYPRIFPNFQNCARCVKDLKDNKDNSLHLGRKYARIFVLGYYLFLVAHSFPQATLSENSVRYSEQIMSADKYPSMFSRQMEAIVYLSTCIFRSGQLSHGLIAQLLEHCTGIAEVTGSNPVQA